MNSIESALGAVVLRTRERDEALAEVERLRAALEEEKHDRDASDEALVAQYEISTALEARAEAAEAKLLDYKAEVAHLRAALQQTSYAATCLQRSLRAWARPITGMGANISSEDRGRWRMALAEYDKAQPLVDAIILAPEVKP